MRAFSLDLVRQAFEKTAADAVPRKLLLEADADPRLRGYVHPDDQTRVRVPIKAEGRTVGFYTPRKTLR